MPCYQGGHSPVFPVQNQAIFGRAAFLPLCRAFLGQRSIVIVVGLHPSGLYVFQADRFLTEAVEYLNGIHEEPEMA